MSWKNSQQWTLSEPVRRQRKPQMPVRAMVTLMSFPWRPETWPLSLLCYRPEGLHTQGRRAESERKTCNCYVLRTACPEDSELNSSDKSRYIRKMAQKQHEVALLSLLLEKGQWQLRARGSFLVHRRRGMPAASCLAWWREGAACLFLQLLCGITWSTFLGEFSWKNKANPNILTMCVNIHGK